MARRAAGRRPAGRRMGGDLGGSRRRPAMSAAWSTSSSTTTARSVRSTPSARTNWYWIRPGRSPRRARCRPATVSSWSGWTSARYRAFRPRAACGRKRFGARGQALSAEIEVAERLPTDELEPAVAAIGTQWIAAYTRGDDLSLRVRRFDGDTPLEPERVVTYDAHSPAVAALPPPHGAADYALAWVSASEQRVYALELAGGAEPDADRPSWSIVRRRAPGAVPDRSRARRAGVCGGPELRRGSPRRRLPGARARGLRVHTGARGGRVARTAAGRLQPARATDHGRRQRRVVHLDRRRRARVERAVCVRQWTAAVCRVRGLRASRGSGLLRGEHQDRSPHWSRCPLRTFPARSSARRFPWSATSPSSAPGSTSRPLGADRRGIRIPVRRRAVGTRSQADAFGCGAQHRGARHAVRR